MRPLSAGRFLSSDDALRQLLLQASVRVTPQRMGLARLLFDGEHRHVVASELHLEAVQAGLPVSLATVYNTLSQFVRAGLLREVVVTAEAAYFDTNIEPHGHVYDESTRALTDVMLPDIDLPDGIDAEQVQDVELLFRIRTAAEGS